MKSALCVLACLLLLSAQGQPSNQSNKCKCSHRLLTKVRLQSIQREPDIYQPSTFCPRTEIIITVANKEKCVDPNSRIGQVILNLKNKIGKTSSVQITTASGQMSTSILTRPQGKF